MAEPDVPGALARRTEEYLRRRRVGVLFKEVMLDNPGIVVAELIRELELIERLLQQVIFAGGSPGTRELMFLEHAELHGTVSFNRPEPARPWPAWPW
jgi:hypothetical protein